MAKYHKDKSFRVTVVDGTVKTGLYAKDGSTNVVNCPLTSGGGGGSASATWNSNDLSAITLSNNNLTATATASSNCGVRANIGLSTGKYYFEYTMTGWGNNIYAGLGLSTASFSSGLNVVYISKTSGGITVSGTGSGMVLGARANGDTIGIAVDLSAKLIWFRVCPSGSWNATSGTTNDPATGTGGASISTLSGALYPMLTLGRSTDGDVVTANFGSSAFLGTAPSGFTSGWTGTSGTGSTTIYASLDPASTSLVTLSNNNLTATNTATTSAAQGCMVVQNQAKTTGKWYTECKLTTVVPGGGGNRGFGIGDPTSTYANMGNSATVGVICYCSSGGIFANGVNTAISITGVVQGDTIGCAVDLDNRKIWFRKNTGIWNNNASNNPTTNVGGINIPAGSMVPFLTFGGTVGTAGNVHTVNFGTSPFVGTVPSSYNAGWAVGSSGGANTWNPADQSNITLSNGNFTATNSVATSGVRGTLGRVAGMGKYYYEFVPIGTSIGVGIARQSATLNAISPLGAAVVRTSDGAILVNNGNSGASIGACSGIRVDVAIDLNNQLIWFRNSTTGLWNGNATGDPATGVFGVSISPILNETVYPYAGTETTVGQIVNANFGATPFSGTIPANYIPGWGQVLTGSTARGTYHPCGALNVLRAPGPVSRLRAANGAMWVTTTPYANRGTKITIVSGTLP